MATPGGRGKELERLVAMLERALAGSDAKIEAPSRRLLDRDTGKPREHDVLITWDRGHHQIVTAIECRDRSRPIGVPDVEAFADKCDATGVHHKVIVSASGFRNSARQKAATRAISCMEMTEAAAFDWLNVDHISGYQRQFGDMDVRVMFNERQPDQLAAIYDAEDNELPEAKLLQGMTTLIPAADDPELEVGKIFPVRMKVMVPGWTAKDSGGDVWPIDHLQVRTSFTTVKTVSPITRHSYTGQGRNYALAVAEAPIAGVSGNFIMVQRDDEGETTIYWVPDKPTQGGDVPDE